MRKKAILAGVLACISFTAQAQDNKAEEPKGKVILEVFGNFHTGFGNRNKERGFELGRSYLGYQYNFGKGLSARGVLDIGKSKDVSDYERLVYIKHAMLSWQHSNLTLNGGLIPTTLFKVQESFWGKRYAMKSFQDEYKFGSSADLGLSAAYRFTDWLSADAIFVNGEGFKKIQVKDGFNYGIGVTLTPVKGLVLRVYGGLNESGEKGKKAVGNLATFAGYKHEKFSVGAEYNHLWNAGNSKGADRRGLSVYASVNLSSVTELYARFDDTGSKNGWNKADDESAAILGAQFKMGKHVKIAPLFKMEMPKADGGKNGYYAYINCYFGL